MKTKGDRLQWLMDQRLDSQGKPVTMEELGKAIGKSKGTVCHWINGYVENPSAEPFQNAVKYLGGNLDWVLTGRGEPFAMRQNVKNVTEIMSKVVFLPILKKHEVCDYVAHLKLEREPDMHPSFNGSVSNSGLVLVVDNDQMISPIPSPYSMFPGAMAIVDPEKKYGADDIILVQLKNKELLFRKIIIDGGEEWLVPLNHIYQKIKRTGDMKVMGKLIEVSYQM